MMATTTTEHHRVIPMRNQEPLGPAMPRDAAKGVLWDVVTAWRVRNDWDWPNTFKAVQDYRRFKGGWMSGWRDYDWPEWTLYRNHVFVARLYLVEDPDGPSAAHGECP